MSRQVAGGVSTGKDPVTGKRTQRTITGPTKKAVEAEVRRIGVAVDKGTYTKPWDGTVAEILDDYLESMAFEREANTRLSYTKALLPARDRLGRRPARSVTLKDIEQLRDWMLTEGRRRGGKPGTPLGPRSVWLTLGRLSAAFERACRLGHLAANPCRYIELPSQAERDDTTWTEAELRRFLARAARTRLAACSLLSALGLRRGEVLGLKWSDISVSDGTPTIARSRVLVDGEVIVKSPKSKRSWRVLPLFEPVTGALEALQARQRDEMDAAGPAYVNSGYVVADELGQPVHPDWYSDEFARLYRAAELPKIRLHDTRGTMGGILEQAGVSPSLRAAWLGHAVEVTRKNYTPKPKDLTPVSTMLSDIFKAA